MQVKGSLNKPIDFKNLDIGLRALSDAAGDSASRTQSTSEKGFSDLLKEGISEVNKTMKASEQSSIDLATGKSTNIHETMLAAAKAELGFDMLVQMRNKAIEAYQEVMRMQV